MSAYSAAELMAVVLSRELRDGEVAVMGAVSAIPMAACRLAQLRHAPGLWFVAGGSGAVNPRLEPLVLSSCDEQLLRADAVLPLPDVVALEGRAAFDVFFAGGLQIDAFGNCNLAAVGDPGHPTLRGPGGVGLPFLPLAGRVLIYTESHSARTLVEHVDFVSGPGTNAALTVTPLAVFDFTEREHRMRLRSLHPGVAVEHVLEATGFRPALPADLPETQEPSPEELALLRRIDSAGVLRTSC